MRQVAGVVVTQLRRELQVGAHERCAKLSHEFFHGIAFVSPAPAPEIPVEPALVLGPVGMARALLKQFQ